MLLHQLRDHEAILVRRKKVWERYRTELDRWAGQEGITMPIIPDDTQSNHHIFFLMLPSRQKCNQLIRFMRESGHNVTRHYSPLHLSPMGRKLGYNLGDLPVTERIAETLVRLPLDNYLEDKEQSQIIRSLLRFK